MISNIFSVGPNAEPEIDSGEAHLGDQKEAEQKKERNDPSARSEVLPVGFDSYASGLPGFLIR